MYTIISFCDVAHIYIKSVLFKSSIDVALPCYMLVNTRSDIM
jgi:hypothetical protein